MQSLTKDPETAPKVFWPTVRDIYSLAPFLPHFTIYFTAYTSVFILDGNSELLRTYEEK